MIVDTSITVSPIATKGLSSYVVEDWKEEGKSKSVKEKKGQKKNQSGVDTQGKWLKKSGKI
ncbi:MAG: hypothetical protein ACMUEL_09515 [Flavobacteriales bacterium Tduv]